MAEISPTGSSGGAPYKAQYAISPEIRKFWEKMFHGVDLSDQQLSQMNDQFIRNVWNEMNHVLQWALQQQKERNQDSKESG